MYISSFIQAIRDRAMIEMAFYSKEDGGQLQIRKCAPMDFGPSRRAHLKNDRFHVWDYDSDKGSHVLSLSPEQVQSIKILNERFDPSDFVRWKTNWIVNRDWGMYS